MQQAADVLANAGVELHVYEGSDPEDLRHAVADTRIIAAKTAWQYQEYQKGIATVDNVIDAECHRTQLALAEGRAVVGLVVDLKQSGAASLHAQLGRIAEGELLVS